MYLNVPLQGNHTIVDKLVQSKKFNRGIGVFKD
jgi:hypothetical protein